MRAVILAAAILLAAGTAWADEQSVELKNAPGRDVVEQNCAACHSLDYIPMNSPFLDRPKWEATVKKMMGPYGAPIEEKDVPAIVDYLAKNYGG